MKQRKYLILIQIIVKQFAKTMWGEKNIYFSKNLGLWIGWDVIHKETNSLVGKMNQYWQKKRKEKWPIRTSFSSRKQGTRVKPPIKFSVLGYIKYKGVNGKKTKKKIFTNLIQWTFFCYSKRKKMVYIWKTSRTRTLTIVHFKPMG